MTIETINNNVVYDPDGIQDSFVYNFLVTDASHMKVYFDGEIQVLGFTVTGVGDSGGGTVDFDVSPSSVIDTLVLQREIPLVQLAAYPPFSPFPSQSHERALDNLTMITQQLAEELARSMTAPVGETGDFTLPGLDERIGKALGFDSSGEFTITQSTLAEIDAVVANASSLAGFSFVTYLSRFTGWADAIEQIGETETSLIIDVSRDLFGVLTVPQNISLMWLQGNLITGSTTMIIQGHIAAGPYRIFGAGMTISYAGNPGIPFIYPEWDGDVGDIEGRWTDQLNTGDLYKFTGGSHPGFDTIDAYDAGAQDWIRFTVDGISAMEVSGTGMLFVTDDCSALSFTDRSSMYTGPDAVELLKAIQPEPGGSGDPWKEVDHKTLPDKVGVVRKEPRIKNKITGEEIKRRDVKNYDKKKFDAIEVDVPGRDIGAQLQVATRAIILLSERIEALENKNK